MKSQQTSVGYRVKDSTKYGGTKKYGFKQLSRIGQKQYQFKFATQQKRFQFQIQFNVPAVINEVQIKAKFVHQMVVSLYQGNNKSCEVHFVFDPLQLKVYRKKSMELAEKSVVFSKAVVRIQNFTPMATHINYLLFKGFKERMTKKIPKQSNQLINELKQNIIKGQKTKAVRAKKKQKQVKKTSPSELIKQVESQKYRKTEKQMNLQQQRQFQKAIELSKKELTKNKDNEKQQYMHKMIDQKKQDNQTIKQQEQEWQFFQYEVTQWQRVRNVFQNVKPQWIQAQRKAEEQKKIQQRHSIAQKIKGKIFKNMEFLFIGGKQCIQLTPMIQQLGGKIIEEPKEGCFIITNKTQSISTSLKNIKFVKPQYIKQCSKMQVRLDQSLYRP